MGNTAFAWSSDAVWTCEEGWVDPELDHIGTCPRRVELAALGATLPAWMRPGSAVGRVGVARGVLVPFVIEIIAFRDVSSSKCFEGTCCLNRHGSDFTVSNTVELWTV